MDVETTQAIEELGLRIDQLAAEVKGGFADVRGEMRREFMNVRAEVAVLREEVRTGLDSNWSRTQVLFESLRGDIQLLAGHVADLASRRS